MTPAGIATSGSTFNIMAIKTSAASAINTMCFAFRTFESKSPCQKCLNPPNNLPAPSLPPMVAVADGRVKVQSAHSPRSFGGSQR